MVAEDRTVNRVLENLLTGNTQMALSPAEMYVAKDERVSFFVVAKRAKRLRHIVLGYQHKVRSRRG